MRCDNAWGDTQAAQWLIHKVHFLSILSSPQRRPPPVCFLCITNKKNTMDGQYKIEQYRIATTRPERWQIPDEETGEAERIEAVKIYYDSKRSPWLTAVVDYLEDWDYQYSHMSKHDTDTHGRGYCEVWTAEVNVDNFADLLDDMEDHAPGNFEELSGKRFRLGDVEIEEL